MFAALFQIIAGATGAVAGVLAFAFLIVTVRGALRGRAAYEANRALTKPSLWAALKGDMRSSSDVGAGRTNHGLAIDLRTGELISQQRLGSDAVDEVIARKT